MKAPSGNRISLTVKVLFLVAIPLVFVLAAAFLLLDSIDRMDEQALLAEQSQEITDTTNRLLKDLFTIAQDCDLVKLYQKGVLETVEISEIPEIVEASRSLKKLSRLTKNFPRERKIVEATRKQYHRALDAMVKRQQQFIVNGDTNFAGQYRYSRGIVTEDLLDLPKAARFKNKLAREREVKFRESVKLNLFALVLLSFITTVIVLLAIIHILTRPLARLKENTMKRSCDDEEVSLLSGNNEIADVDRAFASLVHAINEANEKEKAILENVNDVICTIDGAGKFATMNKASNEILGYNPDSLVGKYYRDFILSEEAKKISQSIDAVVDGHGSQKFEGRMLKSNGETIDLLWSCYWSDADRSLYLILYDNSHVKQAERLRQEIISMVTHDLRSPLTGISLAYDFLRNHDTFINNKDLFKLVNRAASACNLMNCLINDLLELEKIRSGQMRFGEEEVLVIDLFQECKRLIQSKQEFNDIELIVDDNQSTVIVDQDSMAKAITNLIANAAKFSRGDKLIKLASSNSDGFLEISVQYEGRNISPVLLSTMFEHYQQLDYSTDEYPGVSGLSLALCKAVIEEQGGEIWTENYAQGSAFKIMLPVKPLLA